MLPPLLVVGSINADLYVEIERLPLPGETLLGSHGAVRPGGKGANQAGAAARLGHPTRLVAQVGDDAHAQPLLDALHACGVDLGLVTVSPGETGQAMILLQRQGENSIIVVPGANARWQNLREEARSAIGLAGAILLQREVPDAVSLDAARAAQARGIPVVMDTGGRDQPLPMELLRRLSVLSPNESELARLTGLPTATASEVESAARALCDQGVPAVLVKLGARGCLLVEPGVSALTQPAWQVPVLDTTGAGDCFTAAYTVSMLEGQPHAKRLAFACAAAALCVQVKGALPSMPTRAQVEQLLSGQRAGGRS